MGAREENEKLIKKIRHEGYLKSKALEKAMRDTPRHLFVPRRFEEHAYRDEPLPIGEGQTISQPSTVVAMTEALDVKAGQKVLEIGAGSGWQAALIARMVGPKGFVWTVERVQMLSETAKRNLENAGIKNVKVILGDGSLGLKKHAPYNRIIVTAASPDVPEPLVEQLKVKGKMILPIGGLYTQQMFLVEKVRKDAVVKTPIGLFQFVPLIGKHGFQSGR